MGNSSSTSYTSRTRYTVYCNRHTWINLYQGYSESERNYYINTSVTYCSECAKEENERKRRRAEAELRRKKEAEERRVRALMARLEQEERERQAQAARDREAARETEREQWRVAREKAEQERIKIEKSILKESDEKIQEKTDELKSRNKKTKNPYTAWKKSKTLDTVKDIGNQAIQCSAAGQVIAERVGKIKQELKQSLKKDYKLVKSEVTRYEGYAKEMKSMTTEFIDAFGDIFKTGPGEEEFDKDKFDEDAKEFVKC